MNVLEGSVPSTQPTLYSLHNVVSDTQVQCLNKLALIRTNRLGRQGINYVEGYKNGVISVAITPFTESRYLLSFMHRLIK